MCIQVRVTYQRCSHVHLGYELCPEYDPYDSYCLAFETHPRIDPFCPLCSKLDYRAYRLQTWEREAQRGSETIIRTRTLVQSHFFGQTQLQGQNDCEVGKRKIADESERPCIDSSVHSLNTHSQPPSPIEPPIDPGLLGPHQFLEYRQRLAMVVVADHRPRLSQPDGHSS